jgi:hypothetical protein
VLVRQNNKQDMASDTLPPSKLRQKVALEQGFGLSDWMTMQRQMIPVGKDADVAGSNCFVNIIVH